MSELQVKPIGIVHSPYKTPKEAPHQGGEVFAEIEIFREYEQGLMDIGDFSHLHLIYWLHKYKEYMLSVRTPWDDKPHGLFATRTPHRPNPLGYAVVELIERKGRKLKVRGLDAIEGTFVLDLKPYIPEIDVKPHARIGWLKGKISPRKR